MKRTIIGFSAAVMLIVIGVLASLYDAQHFQCRTHQHIVSRQPDSGCCCDHSTLCTHLPLVIIDTHNAPIPGAPNANECAEASSFTTTVEGEKMLHASIAIMSNEQHNHHPTDQPDLSSDILIRIRGNSSRYFDKKSYLLRLIDDSGAYSDQQVMGMSAHHEWALYGPFLDKTLIRNYICYNIAGEIMAYAPNVRFCEVIINNEYMGLYLMTETITNGNDCRLNISKTRKGATHSGYLIRRDRGDACPIRNLQTFSNYTYRSYQTLEIKYPRTGTLTPELIRFIEQDISDFEKSLYSFDYDTSEYGYQRSIDILSFVDYFLINEFALNYDAGWLSTYLYKDLGGKYRMVVWDFNSAFDNYPHSQMKPQTFIMQDAPWFYMLTKDENFTDLCIRRYRNLRSNFLSEKYLLNYIDDVVEYLGDSIERNFSRWENILEHDMVYGARNPHTHAEAIEQLKTVIVKRGHWMDNNIESLRQFSHESKVKNFNH